MDSQTFFPFLTNNEKLVGKYQNRPVRQAKSGIILTDQRLLCRTRETYCFCFHRSSHQTILLEAIDRIDERQEDSQWLAFFIIWIFFLLICTAGVLLSIFLITNLTLKLAISIASGAVFVVITIILFISACCCFKRKLITLYGTFGSIDVLFPKKQARSFEIQLSEHISQAKMRSPPTELSMMPLTLYTPESYTSTRPAMVDQLRITSDRF